MAEQAELKVTKFNEDTIKSVEIVSLLEHGHPSSTKAGKGRERLTRRSKLPTYRWYKLRGQANGTETL